MGPVLATSSLLLLISGLQWVSAAPAAAPLVSGSTSPVHETSLAAYTPTWMTSLDQWAAGTTTDYPIHASCNSSENALLRQALLEAEVLASHARDHILRYGNSSSYFLKYFGKSTTAEPAGWFDRIVNADKTGVLFRCDDPDHNCATQDSWAGHWRGSNASDETVICELSFTKKWPLGGMCGYGYSVAGSPTTAFFGSDLLHRLYHTDKIGEGVVGHYADSYRSCLQLAIDNPNEAVRNSATLRYFALDVSPRKVGSVAGS